MNLYIALIVFIIFSVIFEKISDNLTGYNEACNNMSFINRYAHETTYIMIGFFFAYFAIYVLDWQIVV